MKQKEVHLLLGKAMSVNLDQVEAFVTAADSGSFSAAAKKLGKSQATISVAVQNLEIDLNVQLFDRSKKLPVLTESGKHVLHLSRELLEQSKAFLVSVSNVSSREAPLINIGLDPKFQTEWVLNPLIEYMSIYQDTKINIIQKSTIDLQKKLFCDDLDAVIGTFLEFDSTLYCDYSITEVTAGWYTNPTIWTFKDKELTLQRMITSVLLTSINATEDLFDEIKYCKRHIQIESIDGLLNSCVQGVGIAYLPDHVAKDKLNEGKLIKLSSFVSRINRDRWLVSLRVKRSKSHLPELDLLKVLYLDKISLEY